MKRMLLLFVSFLLAGHLEGEPGRIRRAVERVPDRYIVVLKNVPSDHVPVVAGELALRHAGRLGVTYRYTFQGFSIALTESQALALSYDPRVLQVEEVAVVHPSSSQSLPTNDLLWHLDRVDQRGWIYQTAGDNQYTFCERAGSVIAYVIDSGINRDHAEFIRGDGQLGRNQGGEVRI